MTELIVDSTGTTKTIDAVKSAIVSDSGGLWGGLWGGGTVGRNQDLVSNKWGAASAYLLVPSVNRAVNLISDALNALTWEIVKNTTPDTDKDADEVVAKSTDVRPRHPLAEAMKRGRKYTKQSILSSICYSELLYGMVLLEPIPALTKDRYLALKWLNPLGVSITVSRGHIDRFFYSGTGGAEPSAYFDPDEIAYTHNFNPYDDFRGRGILEVAMDDINISRNLKRFVQAFFRNNAQPSFVVSPHSDRESWSDTDVERTQRYLSNNFKGADNAFGGMVVQKKMELTPFEQPNPGEQYEINAELRREIYTVFGVPIAMAGDTEGTSYQNPKETLDWFYTNTVIPLADKVTAYFNEEVMPFFDESGDYRFRFDTSEFDFVSVDDKIRSEVATSNYQAGIWTKNEARTYTKADADPAGDLYMTMMTPAIAPELPVIENPTTPQLPAGDTVEPVEPENAPEPPQKAINAQREAYVAIPLPNNPYLMALQDEIRAMGIDGVNYQSPETFHVTLLYSTDMSDAVLSKISQDDTPYAVIELTGKTIGLFENGDERALHIALDKTPALMSVQRELYQAALDNGLADSLSEYSNPKVYKPHITLAYLPADVVDVPLTCDFKAYAASVAFNRDDYREVASIPVEQPKQPQKAIQDTPEAELAAWLKVALKSHKRPFEPIHLRGDFGDWLSDAVQATDGEPDAIKTLFGKAKDKLAVKSVQATRIDFEDAFAASLSEALAGNVTRRRWSTIVRSLISRYGNMAYRDGLKDGGVDAEPDEAEQQQIADLIREQSQYVTNLGAKLFKDEDTVSPAMADQKPAMWWNKSLLPFYVAGEVSANGNVMKEFAGPDGEESCATCMQLKGQRHRLKDWDRRQLYPGKDTHSFECGGWQCEHTLVTVKGRERGNWLG